MNSTLRPAFDEIDAVIHLAGSPETDGTWEGVHANDIVGMQNVLRATREASVDTFVFGSANHVVGMYEVDNAPGIYYPDFDPRVTHDAPHRPDSYYGTSKTFGEDLGRYYVENYDSPTQFYALRICSVRHEEYDHPYGDAEHGVDDGDWERGSDEYDEMVAHMKAMWQSRRDLAHHRHRARARDSSATTRRTTVRSGTRRPSGAKRDDAEVAPRRRSRPQRLSRTAHGVQERRVDVVGVTTVMGNTELEHTTRNARSLVAFAGRSDIPVVQGTGRPFADTLVDAEYVHGPSGIPT